MIRVRYRIKLEKKEKGATFIPVLTHSRCLNLNEISVEERAILKAKLLLFT